MDKKTLWANTGGVDISLDSLSPGVSREKAPMPSMNQLSGQQFGMQSSGMMSNQFSPQSYNQNMMTMQNGMTNMNLGMNQVRMQQNMAMRPNVAMHNPNMGMVNMGMQNTTMAMGVNRNMNQMGYGMGVSQQQTNFAQFKAS